MNKKVLVTGATGFIGKYCLPLLEMRGYRVIPISSRDCDLFDLKAVASLLSHSRPSHLLHLAWITTPGKYWNSEDNWRWLDCSRSLFTLFKASGGKRIAAAGSCAEYEWNGSVCFEEKTPIKPFSLYGKCKNDLHQFLEKLDISYAWGRIFHLYGPFEPAGKLFSSVILNLLGGSPFHCSSGALIRDYSYVEDVADALVAILDTDIQGAFNIASGSPLPIRDICQKIGEKIGAQNLLNFGTLPERSNDPEYLAASVQKLFQQTQWRPKFNIDQGIEKTINWWKNNEACH